MEKFLYEVKSPIWISESEGAYDLGTQAEYWLSEASDEAFRELEQALAKDKEDLADYIDCGSPLKGAVESIKISADRLGAIATVIATRELSQEEIAELEDELLGQYSDGWGEGFEQFPIGSFSAKVQVPCESEEDEGRDSFEHSDEWSAIERFASFWTDKGFWMRTSLVKTGLEAI